MAKTARLSPHLVLSLEIRSRALLDLWEISKAFLFQAVPSSNEYDYYLSLDLDELGMKLSSDFYYGMRCCFFHGDPSETFSPTGALGSLQILLNDVANRGSLSLLSEKSSFWSAIVINWVKAHWIGAHHVYRNKIVEGLNISFSIVQNLSSFINAYTNVTSHYIYRLFEVQLHLFFSKKFCPVSVSSLLINIMIVRVLAPALSVSRSFVTPGWPLVPLKSTSFSILLTT